MADSTGGRDGIPLSAELPADPWRFQRWAFGRETGSVARKAVLSVLAMMADAATGRCEAKQATIAQAVELSERAVRGHLAALAELGLIARRPQFRRDGRRRGDEYVLLAPWVSEWPDGQPVGQPADLAGGEIDRRKQGSGHDRKHSSGHDRKQGSGQELPPKNDRPENERTSSSDENASLSSEIRADADALLKAKHKVDGRIVSESEMLTAAAALAEFNRQAAADFGLGANLRCIVMRVRERPSWDGSKHVRLVQSAWRIKWWEKVGRGGRPTPQVIYGNARVFEQVAQDAAEEAAGRQVHVNGNHSGLLKRQVWPDGRTFDELTPREQANAREAVMMGLKPWEAGRDAAPIVPSGQVVTAATLLSG